jgi:putative transposase
VVAFLRAGFGVRERRACRALAVARSSQRYQSVAQDQAALRLRLRDPAAARVRYCYRRRHVPLQREGWAVNHKRVYRLYRLEDLSLRLKPTRKRVSGRRGPQPAATRPNECWSLDFMADRLFDGRRCRVLTTVDTVTRESPAIEADVSLPGTRAVEALDRLASTHGTPEALSVDNGPEFTSKVLDEWAYRHGVRLEFNRPGKPTDHAFVESFTGHVRAGCLDRHWFLSLEEARAVIEAWRVDSNTERPHRALRQQTPAAARAAWHGPPGLGP